MSEKENYDTLTTIDDSVLTALTLYFDDKDPHKAIEIFKNNITNYICKSALADSYLTGKYIKQDVQKAKNLLLECIDNERDDVISYTQLAFCCELLNESYENYLIYYKKALDRTIDDNDSDIEEELNNYGECLLYKKNLCGLDPIDDEIKIAINCFEKAVELNQENSENDADLNLGYCYYNGIGKEMNKDLAYTKFMKGINKKQCEAYYHVVNYYYDKQQYNDVLSCISMAEEFEDMDKKNHNLKIISFELNKIYEKVGNCYYYGLGTEINYINALEYFNLAKKYDKFNILLEIDDKINKCKFNNDNLIITI